MLSQAVVCSGSTRELFYSPIHPESSGPGSPASFQGFCHRARCGAERNLRAFQVALKTVSDHLIPGRWEDTRQPNQKELEATTVIAISLNEASAKIWNDSPGDEAEDYSLPIWAGVLPLVLTKGTLIPDPILQDTIDISDYLH